MAELIIDPPLIAHRGASAYAPENTLAAFIKAQQLGVRWVEFDVMLTRCGEVVVIHDETLERTTDGVGEVSHYPYSYLQTLDAGSWFGAQFKGEKIPTLKEVLVFLAQHSMCVNVEVKAQAGLRRFVESLRCWKLPGLSTCRSLCYRVLTCRCCKLCGSIRWIISWGC
jgi:glycerophosphoryl diester phosphodiesterase